MISVVPFCDYGVYGWYVDAQRTPVRFRSTFNLSLVLAENSALKSGERPNILRQNKIGNGDSH